jgi:hypothetical protein
MQSVCVCGCIYSPFVCVTVVLVRPDGMEMSKHVAVYITQTDCCDVYCYGIDLYWLGAIKIIQMHGTGCESLQ